MNVIKLITALGAMDVVTHESIESLEHMMSDTSDWIRVDGLRINEIGQPQGPVKVGTMRSELRSYMIYEYVKPSGLAVASPRAMVQ